MACTATRRTARRTHHRHTQDPLPTPCGPAPAPRGLVVTSLRERLPDAVAGAVVLALGVAEALRTLQAGGGPDRLFLVVLVTAGTVAVCRVAPVVALGVTWGLCATQVVTQTPVMLVQVVAIMAVAFGCARWGRAATVALSAVSIPLSVVVAGLVVLGGRYFPLPDDPGFRELVRVVSDLGDTGVAGGLVFGLALLGGPWLAGLALRSAERARVSRARQVAAEADAARAARETAQAREIARLREEQGRLARDVHDVVGHSLAVILAQAESAQYVAPGDLETLKATMATIATSARGSLQDVRHVLQPDPAGAPAIRERGLDHLLEGVRSSGHEIVSVEDTTPRPMPPELEVVAYRVLQEMLTNAIRHGRRDVPVRVERHWGEELRLVVRNAVGEVPAAPTDHAPGSGLEGMRRRLESVGGRLDTRRGSTADGATFTTTAWLPLRAAS